MFIGLLNMGFAQSNYIEFIAIGQSQIEYLLPFPKDYLIQSNDYKTGKKDYKVNKAYVLCIYYCPPAGKNWILDYDIVKSMNLYLFIKEDSSSNSNFKFYGKKGYKYAYSFYGEDSKPIKLNPVVNETIIHEVESKWKVE